VNVFLQIPHAVAAVGQKYHLLVFSHSLRLQQFP
jgi:hypothetical protein